MPYWYEVRGWKDYNDDPHDGEPQDMGAAFGLYVHVWNSEDPEDDHWWWTYSGEPEDWEDWQYIIEAQMEMHGYA